MGIFSTKKEESQKKQDAPAAPKTAKKADKKTAAVSVTQMSDAGAYDIRIMPIVTEKSHRAQQEGKYTFRVAKHATKKQIKAVVEDLYHVTVEQVRVIVVKPKKRTVKYDRGYQSLTKKAVVTLKKGDHITVFEGA